MLQIEVRRAESAEELARCQALRRAVFVEEQGVDAAIEADGRDGEAVHFLAFDGGAGAGGALLGCARLRVVEDGVGKAERVAVRADSRGQRVGRALMDALESYARAAGLRQMRLSAQAPVVPFYERLGYTCFGEPFVEANIPHRWMSREL